MTEPPTPTRRPPLLPLIFASGFGSGYSPFAPGTAGTAVCGLLFLVGGPWLPLWADLPLAIALTLLSVPCADAVARALGRKDPGLVVSDEFAGYAFTVAFLPKTWPWLLAAFFVFRILDIVKPPPCRRLELLPGGWGITMDDVAAGIYGNVLLQLARLVFG